MARRRGRGLEHLQCTTRQSFLDVWQVQTWQPVCRELRADAAAGGAEYWSGAGMLGSPEPNPNPNPNEPQP